MRVMKNLESKLKSWHQNNLITSEQAHNIAQYERQNQGSSSYVLYSFFILGAVITGIGLVALAAAHWESIPPWVKLSVDALLLVGTVKILYDLRRLKKTLAFEVTLVFFMLLVSASIELVVQIYQLGPTLAQQFFLWSVLTGPAALLAKRVFAPFVWAVGFFTSLSLTVLESEFIFELLKRNAPAIVMSGPLLAAALSTFFRSIIGSSGQTRAFEWMTLLTGLFCILYGETLYLSRTAPAHYEWISFTVGYGLLGFINWKFLSDPHHSKIQKQAVAVLSVLYLYYLHIGTFSMSMKFVNALFTLSIFVLSALLAGSFQREKLFQFFVTLIGLRVIILYFQALGGLVRTGLGLVVSGILVLALAYAWSRHRKSLTQWVQKKLV